MTPYTINPAGNPTVTDITERPTTPAVAARDAETEHERFESLAGRLARVPKSELDQQRRGDED